MSSFSGSLFALQHLCREIPFTGNACNPGLTGAHGAHAEHAATLAPRICHCVSCGNLSQTQAPSIAASQQNLSGSCLCMVHPVQKVKYLDSFVTLS